MAQKKGCTSIIVLLILIGLIIALRQIIVVVLVLGAFSATIYGLVKRDKFKQLDSGKRIGAIALVLGCLILGIYLAQSGDTNIDNPPTEVAQETPTEVAQEIQQPQEVQQPQETQHKESRQSSDETNKSEETEETTVTLPTTNHSDEIAPENTSKGTVETSKGSAAKPSNEESKDEKSAIALVKAIVTRVVDGDTVQVKLDNGTEAKVRMIGVDTPESTTKQEPYGKEASNFTKNQLEGKVIYLEKDISETDKYGRLLRYIWLEPPTEISEKEIRTKMFNAVLLLEGYAQVATYPPDVKYVDYFTKFQKEAREADKGLWALESDSNLATNTEPHKETSSANKSTNSQISSQEEQPSKKDEITVYITETGTKYHKDGCRYLKSKIPMSLSEAKETGYKPCSVCKPPQ